MPAEQDNRKEETSLPAPTAAKRLWETPRVISESLVKEETAYDSTDDAIPTPHS